MTAIQRIINDHTVLGRVMFKLGDIPSTRAVVISSINPLKANLPPHLLIDKSLGLQLLQGRTQTIRNETRIFGGRNYTYPQYNYGSQNLGTTGQSTIFRGVGGAPWLEQTGSGTDSAGIGYNGTYYYPPTGTNAPVEWSGTWNGRTGRWVDSGNGRWAMAVDNGGTGAGATGAPSGTVNGYVYNPATQGYRNSADWGSTAGGFTGVPSDRWGGTESYRNANQKHWYGEFPPNSRNIGWFVRDNAAPGGPDAGWHQATGPRAEAGYTFNRTTGQFEGRDLISNARVPGTVNCNTGTTGTTAGPRPTPRANLTFQLIQNEEDEYPEEEVQPTPTPIQNEVVDDGGFATVSGGGIDGPPNDSQNLGGNASILETDSGTEYPDYSGNNEPNATAAPGDAPAASTGQNGDCSCPEVNG